MSKQYYPRLDETVDSRVLPNGLTVKVVHKPGFQRKLAYYVTDFGSIHTHFRLDGQTYQVPEGIAHFLEHKLFELPGRDVMTEFAALGGNVNAFTSYDMTAYYVSCTANFEQNLRLLLEFVSTPYFPEESVQREMGIIDQEIAMCRDEPSGREFEILMERMYRNHPVRIPILGTEQTIRRITPQLLELCHRAFYTPANMILCVVGDVDADAVAAMAEEILGTQYRPAAQKLRNWPEEMDCHCPPVELCQEIAAPTFQLGFKCEAAGSGADALRLDVMGYLAAELLLGESSALYLRMYEDRIIGSSFGAGFETIDGCAMLTCGGDSEDPQQVLRLVLERAEQIARDGVDSREFMRLKRGTLGRRIRDLDSFDALCFRICAYHFQNFDYLNFPTVIADVSREEVCAFVGRIFRESRSVLVRSLPMK